MCKTKFSSLIKWSLLFHLTFNIMLFRGIAYLLITVFCSIDYLLITVFRSIDYLNIKVSGVAVTLL